MPGTKSVMMALTRQKDVFLLIVIVVVLLMMILPLPTFLMDVMITLNISASILIMLMALQLKNPVEFSTFPSLLLVTTLFRLAISISTTRLILLEGDAGRIVETFGEVVISGNLIVGLVIFMIITVVQFLVITKGADRVAEVGARFTLDGLPGKQMSVDADVRAGLIDQNEAKDQREVLEQETKLFGAMDGAMKFVKGDAIAGLVITVINLLGGIGIGMAQLGYSFDEALGLYALLTIGDGLVAQIPALLISVSAGTIVTRVTNPRGLDLGTEIGEQISANHRTMMLGGMVIAAFGFIPGFPTAIFLVVGIGMSGAVYFLQRKKSSEENTAAADWEGVIREHEAHCKDTQTRFKTPDTLRVVLPRSMAERSPMHFQLCYMRLMTGMEKGAGVPMGVWRFEIDMSVPDTVEIAIGEDVVATTHVETDTLFVKANLSYLEALEIPCLHHCGLAEGAVVAAEHGERLDAEGIEYCGPIEMILEEIKLAILTNLDKFLGFEATSKLLTIEAHKNAALVADLKEKLSVDQISAVLKLLADERVPITSRTRILESILEWAPKRPDPFSVLQQVRITIGDFITKRFAPDGFLPAMIVAPSLESIVREGFRKANDEQYLVIDSGIARHIVRQVRKMVPETHKRGSSPVLLTQQDIRRAMHNVLRQHGVYVPVLAYQEIQPDTLIYPVGFVSSEAEDSMAA
ncbi:MAG: flagellar biosynthesis protein FlhA [Pseudomonadota bacterium]